MSSKIEWTNETWNPVAGCAIMTKGCTNCYAMEASSLNESRGQEKYKGLTRKSGGRTVWTGEVREWEPHLEVPRKWKKGKNIFVNSMSDLFHPDVSVDFIKKVWKVMRETPQHNYQILTKRPDIMLEMLTRHIDDILPNVLLGTSVEDNEVLERIDILRKVPAAIRWISFEPLIGPVGNVDLTDIDWAVVGGESTKKFSRARPMKEEWIDEIYEQCKIYNTTFYFKQWGTVGIDGIARRKKLNGREYKGKLWDDMPVLKK